MTNSKKLVQIILELKNEIQKHNLVLSGIEIDGLLGICGIKQVFNTEEIINLILEE
jgi:hypothetical protein